MAAQCSRDTFSLSGCLTSYPASTSSLQRSRIPNLHRANTAAAQWYSNWLEIVKLQVRIPPTTTICMSLWMKVKASAKSTLSLSSSVKLQGVLWRIEQEEESVWLTFCFDSLEMCSCFIKHSTASLCVNWQCDYINHILHDPFKSQEGVWTLPYNSPGFIDMEQTKNCSSVYKCIHIPRIYPCWETSDLTTDSVCAACHLSMAQ